MDNKNKTKNNAQHTHWDDKYEKPKSLNTKGDFSFK